MEIPTGPVCHLTEILASKAIMDWSLESVVRISSFQFIFPILQIKANILIDK